MKCDTVLGFSIGAFALTAVLYTQTFPEILVSGVPAASFFPRLTGMGVIVSCILVIIQGLRKKNSYFNFSEDKKGYLLMFATILTTIIYFLVVGKLHFVLITIVYIILLGRLFGMKLKLLIPASIVASVTLYLVFNVLLNVMLNG